MGKPKKESIKRIKSFNSEEAKKEGCFVFLNELGLDAHYFNQTAYGNLVEFLTRFSKQYKGTFCILLDGVLTSLHRPEYLNEALTYWLMSEVECKRESKKIPNSEQYMMMFRKQLEILSSRLEELRMRLPNAKIILNVFTDELQGSLSQLLNEQLLFRQEELGNIVNELKVAKEKTKGKCRTIETSISKAKKTQITKLQTRLEWKQAEIKKINDEITKLGNDAIYFREKKVRPLSQHVTSMLLKKIYGMFKMECNKYGVELITEDSFIQCGNMVVDYSHSRYPTWTPQKNVHKRLQAMVHGTMDEYFKATSVFFGAESKNNRVDAIVESGHHGVGWKSLQKIFRNSDEINFFNNDKCDPMANTKAEYIVLFSALPFEDQEKIARYLSGKEPVRMSGGKPVGTRKNAVTDRIKNGGVSGVSLLAKDKNGLISTKWIQYESFRDGSVLSAYDDIDIQKPIPAILVTSDPHLGSKQDNITALNGVIKLFERGLNAEADIHMVGQKFKIVGDIQAGDIPEAGPTKWGHCYESDRPRLDIEKHVMGILSKLDINSDDEVGAKKKKAVEVVKELSDLAMQGSNVSMSVLLGWAADYSMEFIRRSLGSCLQHIHVSVPGNHADDVLHRNGSREQDILARMLSALGIPTIISGSGNLFTKTPRVVLGGFSIARVAFVIDYGKAAAYGSAAIFGPIKLFVQHDPKGAGSSGIVGAGKNSGADLAIAGHTHENYICVFKTGHNTFSVAFRASCLQGVDPTQMYFASSLPRTSAAHIINMPRGGEFIEVSIPIEYLQGIGNEIIDGYADGMLKKLMAKIK